MLPLKHPPPTRALLALLVTPYTLLLDGLYLPFQPMFLAQRFKEQRR